MSANDWNESDYYSSHDPGWTGLEAFGDFTEELEATTYLPSAKPMMRLQGKEMAGKPCPTCGSKLVVRTNRGDGRKFIACDKKKRKRCPFTMNMNETLLQRTERVKRSVLQCQWI